MFESTHFSRRAVALICTALTALLVGGCGASRHPIAKVSGKVTLDGKAISMGTVVIASEDGRYLGKGPISEDGTYTVPNAPVGPAKISIELPPVPGVGAVTENQQPKDMPSQEEMMKKMFPPGTDPSKMPDEMKKAMFPGSGGPVMTPEMLERKAEMMARLKNMPKVPPRYQDASRSGMRLDVQADVENTFNIAMKSK